MSEPSVEPDRTSRLDLVHQVSALVRHGAGVLSTGDRAQLRRLDPRDIRAAAFFKLAGSALAEELAGPDSRRQEQETRWAAIVSSLAHLGSLHQPRHDLGTALVAAGFSEVRFVRLLRSDADRLVDELPALARFLAAKGAAADFSEAAALLLYAGTSAEEGARRRLARGYYAALSQAKSSSH